MEKTKIQEITAKFLSREANFSDWEQLSTLLKEDDNFSVFENFVKAQYLTTVCMTEYDVKKAKVAIKNKLELKKKRTIRRYKRLAVAAGIALIFGLGIFKSLEKSVPDIVTEDINTIKDSSIDPGSEKAILTLGNGDEVALEKGKEYNSEKVKSNGTKLKYVTTDNTASFAAKPKYNFLTIPKGGQFFVQLSDGTKVWLNSDSKLKYPETFIEGEKRIVEMIYGEAYFQVSPSKQHQGATFSVINNSQEVNVLGTEFNIKAYSDDDVALTTLVEGKIKIHKDNGIQKILKPNQQARITHLSNTIEIVKVDASRETSWVRGLFTFDEESLEEIMKTLSRWYNIEVVFESSKQRELVFTGVLERTYTIQDILKLIEDTSVGDIKFEIDDKTVTIK